MDLIVLTTIFISLHGMGYKCNSNFIEHYSRNSGISVQLLIAGLIAQGFANISLLASFQWPICRTFGYLLHLPSCLVGTYMARSVFQTPYEISYFNFQLLMTAITIQYIFLKE